MPPQICLHQRCTPLGAAFRFLILAFILLAACSGSQPADAPRVTVYKSPSCQCCSQWVEHLREHGFVAQVESERNLAAVRERLGVPVKLAACHTGVVGDYLIEGHVPASDIQRLLQERPKARGLTVPGMPIGSPGMEQGDRRQPYATLLFREDGQTSVFARHGE